MILEIKVELKDHLFNNSSRDAFIKSVEVQLVDLCPQIVKAATKKFDEKNQYEPSLTYSVTETEEVEPII